jgi:hypothetical protein
MNVGKALFAQVMDFLPCKTFQCIVLRYHGEGRARTPRCAERYRCLAFAQLTCRESLCATLKRACRPRQRSRATRDFVPR